MFRLLTSTTPRNIARTSVGRIITQRTCPAAVHRVIQPFVSQPTRSFTRQTQLRQEDDGRAPIPISEVRANLAKSITEEVSQLETSNEWTTEYIGENKFTVKSNAENEGVQAIRTVEGHQIHVTFRASDYTEPEIAENQSSEEEQINEHVFFVDIVNPAGKIMRADCANAPDGELVIHAISFPSAVSADPTVGPARKFTEDLPTTEGAMDFNDLNNSTQENLLDLFESLGVDDDLALFVANQAQLLRTQKLALELGKLKQFVQ